jgi:nucleoid DNA-binding protein
MEKISNKDFIRAISADTGFTQKDIADVFESGAKIILENLKKGIATSVFQGMVVYPATYHKEEINTTFPRARFGKAFQFASVL